MIGTITPQPITVRRGRVEDLTPLEEVYREAYRGLEEYADTTAFRIRNYLNWLYSGEPEGFFVAEAEGRVVGFVSIHAEWWDKRLGETGEIHEICVHPAWKGKGVGRKLIEAAIAYARQRGRRSVSLWVGERNWYARQWYKDLGFEECGIQYGEWVRMVKPIEEEAHAQ
jgi:ribosomal protein S18 acetylase RimI-like enzyme